MKKSLILLMILLVSLFGISYAANVTFSYKDLLYDPRAMGMAGAMTALADSPTSAIYNPALMGEYSRLALKFGFGVAPLDEENINNLNTFSEYFQNLQNDTEVPDGNLSAWLSMGGYLHLGISKLGLTLFGDGDVNATYYKYTSDDSTSDLILEGNIELLGNLKGNGALTVAIPAIDLLGLKLNLGANVRLVNDYYINTSVQAKATQSGVILAEVEERSNDNSYFRRVFTLNEQRYVSFDVGAYARFSPFVAAGIVVKDAFGVPLEGKTTLGYEEGYFDSNGNLNTTPYSEITSPTEVILPEMSLKAGVFVKIPVLATRFAIDADLDKNFTPISYRVGVEQPLFYVLTVRGGAVLDANLQPQIYTLGLGANILLVQADMAVVLDPQDMAPVAGAISGSIRF